MAILLWERAYICVRDIFCTLAGKRERKKEKEQQFGGGKCQLWRREHFYFGSRRAGISLTMGHSGLRWDSRKADCTRSVWVTFRRRWRINTNSTAKKEKKRKNITKNKTSGSQQQNMHHWNDGNPMDWNFSRAAGCEGELRSIFIQNGNCSQHPVLDELNWQVIQNNMMMNSNVRPHL